MTRTFVIKLVVLGEPAVGKTSLVKKFVSGQFSNDYRASIGTNLFITKVNIGDDIEVKIQLWDIAGHEKWINSRHLYYSGSQGAVIIGDLTRLKTFEQIKNFWYADLNKNCGEIPIILIANKNDLESTLSPGIHDLGKEIGAIDVLSTSAKTGDNVQEAFKIIDEKAIDKNF